jgi:hypothetical protein
MRIAARNPGLFAGKRLARFDRSACAGHAGAREAAGLRHQKVIEARNAVDALRILSSHRVDVLICNSKLPPHGMRSRA